MINRLWQFDNNAKVCFCILVRSAIHEKQQKINLYAIFEGAKTGKMEKYFVQKHVDIGGKPWNYVRNIKNIVDF